MTSFVLAAMAAVGMYLVLTARRSRHTSLVARLRRERRGLRTLLVEVGLEGISPVQFAVSSLIIGTGAAVTTAIVFGFGGASLLVGPIAASVPAFSWRRRRATRREVAQEAWPRMIEELRVLTGAGGRPVPQALLEVGLRGPEALRVAFEVAQREWALTTDFPRMVTVLKERLADPTADVVLETLLVAVEVGGDLDRRLAALADDRRADQADRKDAAAKQSGARFARLFVVIVPAGMALAGLSVGDGAEAYRTTSGQLLVSIGIVLIVACWLWASSVMRLPHPLRVFDR